MRGSSNSPLRLVLLGAPGAGKGTQSQLLCARLGIPHISTGDLLREAQHAGSRLGREASRYIDRGEFVPDDLITAVVDQRLRHSAPSTGFALDGFPRTLNQAKGLDTILSHKGVQLTGVLFYDCPEEELIRRLSGRWVCDGCGAIFHFEPEDPAVKQPCPVCGGRLYRREDDTPDSIRTRFKRFYESTQPLIEFYTRRGILLRVDAAGEVEEVYLRSLAALSISP